VLATVLDGFAEIRVMEEQLEAHEDTLVPLNPAGSELDKLTAPTASFVTASRRWGRPQSKPRRARFSRASAFPRGASTSRSKNLSAGWRMRVALAALLLRPGPAPLDEPTNHLDLGAIDWLERFSTDGTGRSSSSLTIATS
jgi:ATPase subunit of ABC transporter with duplicated ATPase domains